MKKLTFPFYLLILCTIFLLVYFVNYQFINDADTLQATVGSAKLDDFTATKFFGVQGIAGFNGALNGVVWNVTGNQELKDCAFFARRSKVTPVKITLNNQQFNFRVYDNVEIRDMKTRREGNFVLVFGADPKLAVQEKIIPNNCGLLIFKKDGDDPVNINSLFQDTTQKLINIDVEEGGVTKSVSIPVSNEDYVKYTNERNVIEKEINNLKESQQINKVSGKPTKPIPAFFFYKFKVLQWEISTKVSTKNFQVSITRILDVPKSREVTFLEMKTEMQKLGRMQDAMKNVLDSMHQNAMDTIRRLN